MLNAKSRCALEAARGADAEQRPHLETEIERAGMNKQSFEHVLVPTHVRSPEPARLVYEIITRRSVTAAALAMWHTRIPHRYMIRQLFGRSR